MPPASATIPAGFWGCLLVWEEDWAEDTGHGETCCLEQLTHGLTGIADMWTDSVEELDYTVRSISLSFSLRTVESNSLHTV